MDGNELSQLKEQVRENNRILKGLQARARWATTASIIKWVVYIAIIFGTYYYIQPYLEQLQTAYQQVQNAAETVEDIRIKANTGLSGLLEQYFGGSEEVSE